MTSEEKQRLLSQAAELVVLGRKVERERDRVRKLAAQGVAANDPRMLAAIERFAKADQKWKRLEAEHLSFKQKLERGD